MAYWLFKSEPDVFSIEDLKKSKNQTTYWDGVRNYQARNFLRDTMKKGDGVLFYHSNTEPLAVVGACEVVKEGYPDFTAWEKGNEHFDPASTADKPVWYMVDIKLQKIFEKPVTLQALKAEPILAGMQLLKRGNRLSVMPVSEEEWNKVIELSQP